MKKTLTVLTLAALLGACTSTQEQGTTTKTEKTAVAQQEINVTKAAILMPINNTNDQDTAELLWTELSKGAASKSEKVMAGEEVEKLFKAAGYSYGDQLTQLDTPEKKVAFQEKLGADGLVYLTVEEIDSSLGKNPFKPTTTRTVKGKATLYVNGVEARTYDIEGTETKKISKEVLQTAMTIGAAFATDMDAMGAIVSIAAIADPVMRSEVAEAVLAMAGPAGTKLQTLMFEKGMLEESPYKAAVDNAVENADIKL